MRSLSTLPVVLLSILSCLSVAFSSPIPARATYNSLVQRSTDYVEKRTVRAGLTAVKAAVRASSSVPRIAAPKPLLALPHPPAPKIKLSNFVYKVIAQSGHTSKQYNGVDPATAIAGFVRGKYSGRTDLKSVTVTDPQHIGGHGGPNHPPDMTNHMGVKEHPVSGKPTPKKHLSVGDALPPIDTKHFAAVSSRPKPPVRSNTI